MFSKYLRDGINLGFAVLLAAILGFILQFFLPMMGPEDGLLRSAFASLDRWMLLLMIVAVLGGILARATVEGNLGGRR